MDKAAMHYSCSILSSVAYTQCPFSIGFEAGS